MGDLSLREPTVGDASQIAFVHVRSWQAAYRGLMDQDFLDSLDVEECAAMWRRRLASPDEGARLVVERDGEVIGFLAGTRVSPGTEEAAEVFSIYLDPSVWRGGIGSALLDAGVESLRSQGHTPVVLWVLDGNERACRFYESRGWVFDGGRKDEVVGGATAPHLRYRLD